MVQEKVIWRSVRNCQCGRRDNLKFFFFFYLLSEFDLPVTCQVLKNGCLEICTLFKKARLHEPFGLGV